MPDVGVLQLKISADAGNASKSLQTLQNKLSAINNLSKDFNTQKIVDGITGIINTVKGESAVSTAVKNLASLLNAITAFAKIKDIGLKETDINKLATLQTVANGFKLGTTGTQLNKLKEALGGEWNTEQADKARQALETLVGGAKSLEENGFKEKVSAAKDAVSQMTAGTAKEVKSVSNEMQNLGQATGRTAGILSSLNGASSMNPFGRLPQAFYSMQGTSLNETKSFVNQSVQQWRDQAEEAKAATKAVETAQGSGDAVTSLARGLKELSNSVKGADMARFADGIKALNSALAKGANSYLTLGRLAGSIKKLKESVQGFKLPSFTGLENLAKSLQENFNAENGLKRIAEGILAVKEAGAGFKAPKVVISTSDSSSTGFATTSERVVEAAQAATESISDMKVATVEATEAVNNQGTVNLASEFAKTKETVVEARVAVDDMIDSEKTAAETMAEISRAAKDVQSNTVDSGFGTEGAQSFDGMAESAERTTEAIARYNEAMEFARQWNEKKPPQEMSNIETARRLVEEFTALANTNEKISDLTTKLGFVINDYDKEIKKAEPSERRLNALQLQIDSLVKQIDTLNSKSIKLDFAREITPENLGELSELDRLQQKRNDMILTLHEEMEANKLSVSQIMTRAGQIDTLTEKIEKLRAKEEEEQAVRLSVRETNEMSQRVNQLDMLIAKSEEAKAAYNALINDPNATNSEQIAAALKINKAELDIQQYNELQGLLANVSPEIQKFAQDQLNAGVSASTLRSKLFDLDGELKQKKTDMKNVADETRSLRQRFNELLFGTDNLSGAMKKMFPSVSGLLSRFKQLVKYRMLRAVIKQISEGFREGYENYYHYSEAIGSGFAPAMDSATVSLLQMKNSIGAAVAPLIQSLVPVLQTVVNWFIEAINYANQFIALIRGQATWSRAVPATAKAFDDQKKAAKGASAAVKDLLADWDELNIIQSETGGGSGSGSATKAEDYLKMFEEESKFNNHVARIVQDIKNSFDNIYELVGLIATGIAGWKISQAFENTLGMLGKLAAGISISIIGVKLAHGGGLTAGLNGGFSGSDIITSIGGAFAAGIGGKLIANAVGFSSPVGFAVGLSVGIAASLIGYIEGSADKADALKWGTNSMTPEQVQQYVEGQFKFPVMARIDLLNGIIENQEQARTALNGKITAFSNSLSKVRIRADGTPEGIQAAADDIASVIGQINQNLKDSQTNLEALLKITPVYSDGGDDVSGEVLSNLKVANKKLSEYFTDIGKEIANWIDKGQKSQWKNNEAEMALQLMEHQKNILAQANNEQIKMDFGSDTALNLVGVMDRDTAEAAYKKQLEIISEYRDKIMEATKNQIRQNNYYAALADAAGLKDDKGNPLSDYYKNANAVLIKQIEDGTIYDDLNPALEDMRKQWIETLKKVYGKEIGTEDFGVTDFFTNLWGNIFGGGNNYFDREMKAALESENGVQKAADVVNKYLNAAIASIDPHQNIKKIASTFGFSIFDLMEPPVQNDLIQIIKSAVGNDSSTAAAIMSALGWNSESIAKALIDGMSDASPVGEGAASDVEYDVEVVEDPSMTTPISAPAVDTSAFNSSLNDMWLNTKRTISQIATYMNTLNGLTFEVETAVTGNGYNAKWAIPGRASGGFVRSGDLVMANENGNFEMMGKMGRQPVVANNDQIVTGITRGVESGNDGIVSALNTLINLAQRIERKEIVAKAVPSSAWGQNNQRSAEQYSRVTGG